MKQYLLSIVGTAFLSIFSWANDEHKALYQLAFEEQKMMLKGTIPIDFTRAVFVTENTYYKGGLKYQDFKKELEEIAQKLRGLIVESEMSDYKTAGNWAAFIYMTEESEVNDFHSYLYDFDDYFGDQDLSKMFVTKLMRDKSGNCHSLPYLYKMICEELGVDAHLAVGPNHLYIMHVDERGSWVNVELTNGSFPKNKWIAKDLVISKTAREKRTYMKALSGQESIALTVCDLANEYEVQFGMDSFYLALVDTALSYYPTSVALLMNKANYYAFQYSEEQNKRVPDLKRLSEMELKEHGAVSRINKLGHQKMSVKQYNKMVRLMEKEKEKEKRKEQKRLKKKKNRTLKN